MAKKVKLSFKNTVSRVKQSFKNECDINRIVARARKTGYLIDPSIVANRQAVFMDCSNVDYMDMLNRVNVAQSAFDALPSDVRSKFDNDVSKLLDFVADPTNEDAAIALDLLPKKVVVPVEEPAQPVGQGEAAPVPPAA